MRPRSRSQAASRACARPGWLVLAASGALLALAAVAHAQSGPTASDAVPPAASPAAPAEIQPGHPPPATTGSTGSSGPRAASPAPLPPGAMPAEIQPGHPPPATTGISDRAVRRPRRRHRSHPGRAPTRLEAARATEVVPASDRGRPGHQSRRAWVGHSRDAGHSAAGFSGRQSEGGSEVSPRPAMRTADSPCCRDAELV